MSEDVSHIYNRNKQSASFYDDKFEEDEDYKVNVSDFIKINTNFLTKAKSSLEITNNNRSNKTIINNQSNNKNNSSILKTKSPIYNENLRRKYLSSELTNANLNESFWNLNESSILNDTQNSTSTKENLNNKVTTHSIYNNNSSHTKLNTSAKSEDTNPNALKKIINKLEKYSSKLSETTISATSNDKNSNVDLSIAKWSNHQLNNSSNYNSTQTPQPESNSTNSDSQNERSRSVSPQKSFRLIEKQKTNSEINLLTNKTGLSNIANKPQSPINQIFDIVERESSSFSIKLSYDHPLKDLNREKNNNTPHTYLDLDTENNLRLAEENKIRNISLAAVNEKKNLCHENNETNINGFNNERPPIEDFEPFKRADTNTPNNYQNLENPKKAKIYAVLNIVQKTVMNSLEKSQRKKKERAAKQQQIMNSNTNRKSIPINAKNEKKTNSNATNSNLTTNSKPVVLDIKIERPSPSNHDEINKQNNSIAEIYPATPLYPIKPVINLTNTNLKSNQNANYNFDPNVFNPSETFFNTTVISNRDTTFDEFNTSNLTQIPKETPRRNATKFIQIKPVKLSKKPSLKEFKYCVLSDLKIGEGEFSETFIAYRYDLGQPLKVAAKRLKNSKDPQSNNDFISEISVLNHLGTHPNVIHFLGFHMSANNSMFMIFEYAEKGDLKRLLDLQRKNIKRELNVNNFYKIKIAYEIANGMEYISSLDIVHKDLAARNILLDKDFKCKISDFGFCKMEFLQKRPIRWMSPEALNKLLFTTASDVWSYGILLWEIYTNGMTPYPGMTDDEVICRINQWYRLYKPHDCPKEVYAIMLSCWKDYHKARPRFNYIKNKLKDIYKSISALSEAQNPSAET